VAAGDPVVAALKDGFAENRIKRDGHLELGFDVLADVSQTRPQAKLP